MSRSVLLRIVLVAVFAIPIAKSRAGLIEYIEKPDAAYAWKLKEKKESPQGTIYDLHLVSQTWQGMNWEHRLQVYQPKDSSPTETMFLFNTGGGPNAANQALALELAKRIGSPIAFLYDIPNQPLFGNKKEDALIAETFCRFLDCEGKDESWPLLFPMAKSVVRSMDAIQAFSKEEWKKPVKSFVVSGASKRGWTTWLTGASDKRVKAIAPLVIDTLNMVPQMEHQKASFGKYSDMIRDYTERKLVPIPESSAAKRLWEIVDPYFYRDRLTMPKLMVNGANDPYWTVDALNLYWSELKGDKSVLIVPNAGHSLREVNNGRSELIPARAVNTLSAFARHMIQDKPWPKMNWRHADVDGNASLSILPENSPKTGRVWVATCETRDFRKCVWKEMPVEVSEQGKLLIGRVKLPEKGCVALYGEVEYEIDNLKYTLSTQVRVCEMK
jgi:PhoPQ-activated pathogenicity-related protein